MAYRDAKVGVLVGILLVCLAICLSGFPIFREARAAENVIKIGVAAPMDFPTGKHAWNGAQIAAEEINASGGVNVKGVRYKIELAKGNTNEYRSVVDSVNAVDRLITADKVDFVVGGHRTESVLAMQEVAADHRKIFLGLGPAHPEVCARVVKDYDRYKYFFRLGTLDASSFTKTIFMIINVAGDAIKNQLGIAKPKVALVCEKAKWTDPMAADGPKILEQMGMQCVGIWRPSQLATDVTAELSAIKSKEAHIIGLIVSGPIGNVLPKQWGELKIPAAIAGANALGEAQSHWDATNGMCNYELTINFINRVAMTEKTIPFFDKFVKSYGEIPLFMANAYDSLYVLKEAVERAGTLATDAVIKELEKTDYRGAIGRIVFYSDDKLGHDVKWGPGYVTALGDQWRDGKLLTVWPDGKAPLDDQRWKGFRYQGTVDYKLPPWMVEYWKGKTK
jgi:branched-chain amino acid transport system substrate-binding protein